MDSCQSIKTVFLEKKKIAGKTSRTFLIVDGVSDNLNIANAIAMNKPLNKSTVKEIGKEAETKIVSYYQKKVKMEGKKIIVMDLDEFPYIKTYIDERDPNEMYKDEDDKFGNDVKEIYNTYDQEKQMPIILVNADINFVGLKVININEEI